MKYESDVDFRRALEERLKNRSRETGEPLERLRKRLVFERCMVRFQKKPESPWILKGGFALELRLGQRARMTKDLDLGMDLAVFGNQELSYSDLVQRMREDLAEKEDDRLVFLVQEDPSQRPIVQGMKAYRFPVEARLAGRVFEKVRMDVILGDPLVPPLEELVGSDILSFVGIPRPIIRVTSRAQHLAEKVHALTRQLDDRINTRVKDLIDVQLLMDMGLPEPAVVKNVVERIFDARQTHPIPQKTQDPPATWVSSFTAMAQDLGLAETDSKRAAKRLDDYWINLFH